MTVELIEHTPNPEETILKAARTCYDSVSRGEENDRKFIRGLVKSGHTAMIEHATATIRFKGVSRALTHELVRHRLFSFAQRSQRYVNESEPQFISLEGYDNSLVGLDEQKRADAVNIYKKAMENAWGAYKALLTLGFKKEDARYVLPNACCTEIVVTGNMREWRAFLALRLSPRAQWEIRTAAWKVLDILYGIAPDIFQDFKDGEGIQLT